MDDEDSELDSLKEMWKINWQHSKTKARNNNYSKNVGE